MGTVKLKPTSPGRRGTVKVLREGLFKGRPLKIWWSQKEKYLEEIMLVGLPFDIEEVLTKDIIGLSTLSVKRWVFPAKWSELSTIQIGARTSR